MPQNRIITAIDVGTDKCVTLIASSDLETNKLRVMGVAAVPSRGMKKSQIIDLEKVLESITESLDGAERMAGLDVKSAFVSLGGGHIASQNSKGVVAVASPDQEIIPDDVERVIEAARAVSLPSDRDIIHVVPKDFKVDSQDGIKDPVGMTGVRLESEAHIITGMNTAMRNMEKCIVDLGLTVEKFVFSGLASSEVVLSETEKELGVAVLDIGAGTSSVCVFVDGSLEYSKSLPIGARHISQDIALGCRVSLDTAEKIKLSLADDPFHVVNPLPGESKQEFGKRRKKLDELKLSNFIDEPSDEVLSKRFIVETVMMPRIQEIFELFAKELKEKHLLNQIPAGVVITGGGAQTIKIAEIARRQLNLPARVGNPVELDGLTSDIQKPSFATSVGLLVYGRKQGGGAPASRGGLGSIFSSFSLGGSSRSENSSNASNNRGLGNFKSQNLLKKITNLLKSLLP
jgi:cell division protein FtsA